MDKRLDLVMGLIVIAFALGYYYEAGQIPIALMRDPLGPSAVPRLVAGMLALAGLWLVIDRLRKWRREPGWLVEPEGEPDVPGHPISIRRVWSVVLVTIGYLIVLPRLGYIITTPLFLAGTLAVLGLRDWRQLVVISLGMTIALYVAFGLFMRVPLPLGALER